MMKRMLMRPRTWGFFIFAITIGLGGWFVVQEWRRKQITIEVNGAIREVRTHAHTVEDVLSEVDIYLDPADKVDPALHTPLEEEMTIVVTKAHQLVLEVDGTVRRIYTHARNPLTILAEQNIQLSAHDRLYVNHRLIEPEAAASIAQPLTHLRVARARRFTLYEDNQLVAEGYSNMATVGELLDEYDLTLYLADQIVPLPHTPLTDGLEIKVWRSSPVTIRVDGRDVATRAIGETVSDVLNMLGMPLSGLDYSTPAENVLFVPDMTIEIVRVVETIEVEHESVAYHTLTLPDPGLPDGERRVIQEGVLGTREQRVRIRRENDRIVSRVVQDVHIVVSPIPEIVAYGSKE